MHVCVCVRACVRVCMHFAQALFYAGSPSSLLFYTRIAHLPACMWCSLHLSTCFSLPPSFSPYSLIYFISLSYMLSLLSSFSLSCSLSLYPSYPLSSLSRVCVVMSSWAALPSSWEEKACLEKGVEGRGMKEARRLIDSFERFCNLRKDAGQAFMTRHTRWHTCTRTHARTQTRARTHTHTHTNTRARARDARILMSWGREIGVGGG